MTKNDLLMRKSCIKVRWNERIETFTRYYVVHERRRHAEDANQQVADGEVEDEQIGDGAHIFAAQHHEAHHAVAHHAHEENEQVGDGEDGGHGGLVEVEVDVGDVVVGRRGFLRPRGVGRAGAVRGGVGDDGIPVHGHTWAQGVKDRRVSPLGETVNGGERQAADAPIG